MKIYCNKYLIIKLDKLYTVCCYSDLVLKMLFLRSLTCLYAAARYATAASYTEVYINNDNETTWQLSMSILCKC